ncbi:AbrB family transcriptional regulator [Elioraea sp.]|uniref:AbrB family transcriptional regulator n=1 Tax=Elioraea sp. TaxID=2185103 RepID=UPI003F7281C4
MPVPSARLLSIQARTLAAAIVGGYAAQLLHVPLAWMIGAMVAAAAIAFTGREVAAPAIARPVAMLVLGTALGQTYTPPVLRALIGSLPALILAGLGSMIAGAAASRMTARIAGIDTKTAYYASVPGGIILMVVLAARAGLSVPTVTLIQTLRMVLVVLTFPPLLFTFVEPGVDVFSLVPVPLSWHLLPLLFVATTAGAVVMRRFGIANAWMFGPVCVSLILALLDRPLSGVPGPLIDVAQVLMGWSLGIRINRDLILRSRHLALASVAATGLLALLCLLVALVVAFAFGLPVAAAILGTAPGGLPEMAITAKVLNLGVPLVLGFHLVRIFLCNLFVEQLYRAYAWAERKLGLPT